MIIIKSHYFSFETPRKLILSHVHFHVHAPKFQWNLISISYRNLASCICNARTNKLNTSVLKINSLLPSSIRPPTTCIRLHQFLFSIKMISCRHTRMQLLVVFKIKILLSHILHGCKLHMNTDLTLSYTAGARSWWIRQSGNVSECEQRKWGESQETLHRRQISMSCTPITNVNDAIAL